MATIGRGISAMLLGAALCAGCGGGKADSTAAKAATAPADTTGMLRIAWTLQSQEDVMGFNVYRGATADGPWEKANAEPIPGHDTTMFEQRYDFFDTGLELGREYHYYVEEITYSGGKNKITPTMSSTAKPRQFYVDKGHNPPAP